jgi:hypothetical protein
MITPAVNTGRLTRYAVVRPTYGLMRRNKQPEPKSKISTTM